MVRLHGIAEEPPADPDPADEALPSEMAALLRRALDLVQAEFEPPT